jgi:hypothetical protein
MPFYPPIVLQAKECAPTLCSSAVFSLGFTFESLEELGARHNLWMFKLAIIIYIYWLIECSPKLSFVRVFELAKITHVYWSFQCILNLHLSRCFN